MDSQPQPQSQRQQRRRRRSALSCQECRRRKIKCDHNNPCAHCLRHGAQCIYQPYADGFDARSTTVTARQHDSPASSTVSLHSSAPRPLSPGNSPYKLVSNFGVNGVTDTVHGHDDIAEILIVSVKGSGICRWSQAGEQTAERRATYSLQLMPFDSSLWQRA